MTKSKEWYLMMYLAGRGPVSYFMKAQEAWEKLPQEQKDFDQRSVETQPKNQLKLF